jgi:hypothetical protein
MATDTENQRPFRVAALGAPRRRYFKSLDAAVAFARSQARQSWNDDWWTVWDRRTDTMAVRVNRAGEQVTL